jgi:hypothetical protein
MTKPVHDYTDLSRMQLYTSFALVSSLFCEPALQRC